ncbi:hypothetical protein ACFQ6N_18850 [Kitasatospora sp. NPDC056446]|uniref:hypothetical protein n=1 Tax=Kitasatospora sp. NPDC056446 TaxID=3345819 RepID=UPI0036B082FC
MDAERRRRRCACPHLVDAGLADYLQLIALLSCDLYPKQDLHIRETGHYRWAADVLNSQTGWRG